MLDAVAELGEHVAGHVLRRLGDEEHADALGADQADRAARSTPGTPSSPRRTAGAPRRGRRRAWAWAGRPPRAASRTARPRSHMSAVDHSSGCSCTAASSTHETTPRPSRRDAHQVGDVELRLAEELGAAAGLQPDERAQQHADGRAGQAADALELGLAVVGVQERQQRPQVGEVQQRQALLRRRSGRRAAATAPASRWRRGPCRAAAARSPRPWRGSARPGPRPPSERNSTGKRRAARTACPRSAARLPAAPAGSPGAARPDTSPLTSATNDRHAGGRQLLGDAAAASSSCPCPVAPAIRPWRFIIASGTCTTASGVHRAVVDAAAEVDRGPVGRVGGGDGPRELGGRLTGRRTGR